MDAGGWVLLVPKAAAADAADQPHQLIVRLIRPISLSRPFFRSCLPHVLIRSLAAMHGRKRSTVLSMSVCLSACMSARIRNRTSELLQIFYNIMLPLAVIRSSSGGIVIHYRYVLLVLRMTRVSYNWS